MAANEIIQLAPGDIWITVQPGREMPWREEPPTLAVEEAAGERGVLEYEGLPIQVPLTLDEAFATVREVYIASGHDSLMQVLRGNRMVQDVVVGIRPHSVEPENVLTGNQLRLHLLIKPCLDHLESLRTAALDRIQELAHQNGLVRLKTARNQIEAEMGRYFAKAGRGAAPTDAFLRRARREDYYVKFDSATVRDLRRTIRECRELIGVASRADRLVDEGYRIGPPLEEDESGQIAFHTLRRTQAGEMRPAFLKPYGVMSPLIQDAEAAHARVQAFVATAALKFPIISRLFATPNVEAPVALEQEMWDVLQSAHAANRKFSAALEADPTLIWHYSPLVQEAMNRSYVPAFSIARTAADEKVGETSGAMRWSSQLALASGLGSLGVVGLASLVGAGAAAPPLIVAVIVVDGAINLYDLLEEYWEYRRQQDAFNATLDPTLSLASEPSLFWLAFTAGLTAVSLIPGGGSSKAAKKAAAVL